MFATRRLTPRGRPMNVPVHVSVPEISEKNASGTGTGTDTFTGREDFSDEN